MHRLSSKPHRMEDASNTVARHFEIEKPKDNMQDVDGECGCLLQELRQIVRGKLDAGNVGRSCSSFARKL